MAALSLVPILDLHDFIVHASDINVLELVNELAVVDRGLVLELAELALVLCNLRLDVLEVALADAPAVSHLRRRARALLLLRLRCFGCPGAQ